MAKSKFGLELKWTFNLQYVSPSKNTISNVITVLLRL